MSLTAKMRKFTFGEPHRLLHLHPFSPTPRNQRGSCDVSTDCSSLKTCIDITLLHGVGLYMSQPHDTNQDVLLHDPIDRKTLAKNGG